jgi:hypothetical protein
MHFKVSMNVVTKSPKIYTTTRAIFILKRRFVLHGVGGAVADLVLAPRVPTGVCGRSFTTVLSGQLPAAKHGPWMLKSVE